MFVMCINFIHTDMCINLTSFVESCWTGNLRILHSLLTTGEWTGTQARKCTHNSMLKLDYLFFETPCIFLKSQKSNF